VRTFSGAELVCPERGRGGCLGVPELRHVRPHGGRTRAAVLVPIRPEEKAVGAAWDLTENVGLMREASRRGFPSLCGGTACWSAPLGGYPRGAASPLSRGMAARRRVEHPWIPFRSECEGMRRDQSSPGHIQTLRTKVCHYAPSSEGALRRGKPRGLGGGELCLGIWGNGGTLRHLAS